jgi:hypothetical protein
MKSEEIVKRVSKATATLFAQDGELFDLGTDGINEQTLTFRLGLYLVHEFANHHVDCEYNRLWDRTKSCLRHGILWMKPDIIVHIRRSDTANLFCVEAKKVKYWEVPEKIPEDVTNKLKALTDWKTDYHYNIGLAWRIAESAKPDDHLAVWFIAGEPRLVTTLRDFEGPLAAKLDEVGDRPS